MTPEFFAKLSALMRSDEALTQALLYNQVSIEVVYDKDKHPVDCRLQDHAALRPSKYASTTEPPPEWMTRLRAFAADARTIAIATLAAP